MDNSSNMKTLNSDRKPMKMISTILIGALGGAAIGGLFGFTSVGAIIGSISFLIVRHLF